MRYGKLRIAWSVTWGVASLVLAMLLLSPPTYPRLTRAEIKKIPFRAGFEIDYESMVAKPFLSKQVSMILAVALGMLPWFPARFSLRTLLIATTLVALVLGLIVWALKS